MLFFNAKKNLWAGKELATDNSFILLWLHCGLCFILLFVLKREQTFFLILPFEEEILCVMCAFLTAMVILTPNYNKMQFVDKALLFYPVNIYI